MTRTPIIGAVVLAAGGSTRMGVPKQLLPWGRSTVIGHLVQTLELAGVGDIVVVTGRYHAPVEVALAGLRARVVRNRRFRDGQMLTSLQVGLASLAAEVDVAVVALGDQPMVPARVVARVAAAARRPGVSTASPRFQGRRGHPFALPRRSWGELMATAPASTLREVVASLSARAVTVDVSSESVLWDLDTPADYARHHPLARQASAAP